MIWLMRTAVLAFALLMLTACNGEGSDLASTSRIPDIVKRLQSADAEVRDAAIDDLDALASSGLSVDEAIDAVRAAAKDFPEAEQQWRSAPASLIRAAQAQPAEQLIPEIESNYSRYPAPARRDALVLLTSIRSGKAAGLYVDLAKAEALDPDGIDYLPTVGYSRAPRDAGLLFPALLDILESQRFTWEVAELLLNYFREGELPAGSLDSHYSSIDAHLGPLLERAAAVETDETGEWLWSEDYLEFRWLAGLLLDLSGYFEVEPSRRNLEVAVGLEDPRLKYFAARSLMSNGIDVADDVILAVAQSHEVRNWLYTYLDSTNQLDRFPSEFRTQEAFAISDMVNWLVYPTELGRAPSEIEVVHAVEDSFDGETYVHYVLKFRTVPPHWSAEDGWMLGVSGPFRITAGPSAEAYGDTFSTFARLEETDIDAYADEVRSLLQEWREHHSKQ